MRPQPHRVSTTKMLRIRQTFSGMTPRDGAQVDTGPVTMHYTNQNPPRNPVAEDQFAHE